MSNKRAVWTKRIEAWRSSGESVAGFCRSHGLTYAQFVYWQRMLRAPSAESLALVPVMVETVAPSSSPIELALPNGVQVRCANVADAIAMARGWSC